MQLTGAKHGAVTAPAAEQHAAQSEESAPAAEAAPAPAYAADTLLLEYVADINAQLTGPFSCPPERWKASLGERGTESEDLLFSWDATGKSKKMDFHANGAFEFQFTTMSISEKGTWTYADGKLAVTTAGGKEYVADLTK